MERRRFTREFKLEAARLIRLLVKIKRDLENQVRGLLKNVAP